MAVMSFATGNALTVKAWSKGLEAEVLKKTYAMKFAGKTSDSLLQIKDELSKGPGDKINYGIRMQLTSAPLGSTDTFQGNESALTIYPASFVIDEVGLPVRWKTTIDQQRVNFDQLVEAKAALSDWMADNIDTSFFNHICGNTVTGLDTKLAGNNATLAPSTGHKVFPSTITADESLGSTNTFTIDLIDKAVEKAKTLSPAIRPVKLSDGGEYFVVFLHPYQTTQLRVLNTQWELINRALLQGGFVEKNPILNGALGTYNGCILLESARCTTGVNSSTSAQITTVRRAVLCGAQSAVMGNGSIGGSPDKFRWVEESFDFDRQQGVAASMIWGLSKVQFNSLDFATVTVSTYAVAS